MPKAECSQQGSTAPCIRKDLCGATNGICADERCAVCCNEKCGICGGPTCSQDPLGASNCCVDDIVKNQATCTSGVPPASPCIRRMINYIFKTFLINRRHKYDNSFNVIFLFIYLITKQLMPANHLGESAETRVVLFAVTSLVVYVEVQNAQQEVETVALIE